MTDRASKADSIQESFKIMAKWLADNPEDRKQLSYHGAVRLSREDQKKVLSSRESLNNYHITMTVDSQQSTAYALYYDPGNYVMGKWMDTTDTLEGSHSWLNDEHKGDIVEACLGIGFLMTAMDPSDQPSGLSCRIWCRGSKRAS